MALFHHGEAAPAQPGRSRLATLLLLAAAGRILAACAPSPAVPTAAPIATAAPASPSPLAVASPSPTTSAPPPSSPAPSPAAAAPPAGGQSEVKIVEPPFRPSQEWSFQPAEVTVKVGTRITWNNTGAVAHTATADDGKAFDSGSIDPKATWSFTPSAPGTFPYHCTFHPWMKGTLTVQP